jgi:hypothetical protein
MIRLHIEQVVSRIGIENGAASGERRVSLCRLC